MKYCLILLSTPFLLVGFIWSFIKQGVNEGKLLERVVRNYFHSKL